MTCAAVLALGFAGLSVTRPGDFRPADPLTPSLAGTPLPRSAPAGAPVTRLARYAARRQRVQNSRHEPDNGLMAVTSEYPHMSQPQPSQRPRLSVKAADDFEVTGTGDQPAWTKAEWTPLRRRQADGHPYDTRFKMLYSKTGLYFLMEGTDRKLTATMKEDFMDLWNEDVFEVFLWTDERHSVYFEYEISPLNKELPILIPNFGGQFLGWRPWHYEKDRTTRKATSVQGGAKESNAAIQSWRAEFFIPYSLLRPLQNVPPKPGTKWRANFYRMDHDDGKRTQWDWAPVGPSFHEFEKFGDLIFE